MMYGTLCTEFYDADKKFASQDEIDFYKNIFNKNDRILEPMCGSGRLLIPLMQAGYNIHGSDNSAFMLKSCKTKAARLNLRAELFETAIETMALSYQYNVIIIPLGSFQLFHPRPIALQALEKIKKHLKPGGKFVLDLYVPWESFYANKENESTEREIPSLDGGIIKCESYNKINKSEQFIAVENKYTKIMNNKPIAEEIEQLHICWYYRYEMALILEKYGFKNVKMQERVLNNENYMTFISQI